MKKLFIMAVICLTGSTLYAQYGPQYQGATATSTLQPAIVGAATGANTGLSIQDGTNNRVRVRQAGTEQSAYSNQNDGSGNGGNLARIRQTGDVNAAISGFRNATDVEQSGTRNESTTRQEGDLNSAITRQGQNDDASARNRGWIRQGVADQAESNTALLEQDGKLNEGRILQTSDNNDAWIVQTGERNSSYVRQDASPNATPGHYAYNEQTGKRNESTIDQGGDNGQGNWAWAYQTGDKNKSIQTQNNDDALGSGFVNYAMVDQGEGQAGLLTPAGGSDLIAVDSDVASQSLNPITRNSIAFQDQDGGDLDAETHQFGNRNYSEQDQTGYGNDAFIIQNSTGSNGNYARQNQSGTNSFATLGQFGRGNKAWQRQSDDDNIVVSSQIGNNNLLNTYQDGDGNRGHTLQHGNSNEALLVQRGGHSYTIEQYGIGNQADVLQLGPMGNFHTDLINCDFEMPRIPDAPTGVDNFTLGDICTDC